MRAGLRDRFLPGVGGTVSVVRANDEVVSQYGRETLVAGKFVLKKGSTGKFHFNLHAANGQVIATSEAYNSKESALNGIESVKKNAADARVEDETND
jgi:uncharacterized protein YegP (UPF0339 family)